MRRNDYDVSNSIRTTDAASVGTEVMRLFKGLYGAPAPELERAFADAARLYRGEHPEYHACDTEYHDIQHVLDVTLAMARLMDGYAGSRREDEPALGRETFIVGVLAALFHDFGYLRRRNDSRHRYGAEYTLVHVSRGAAFLRRYLRELGLGHLSATAATLVHYTGYERPTETIRVSDTLLRRVGHMLGSADILAQMSDRCYLEKCRDRLYPEFVLGNLAGRKLAQRRTLPQFASGAELVQKTPGFYQSASRRLEVQLARAYEYAARHFRGDNLYLLEMRKNIQHAQRVARAPNGQTQLRRQPPSTLQPDIQPYPKDLVSI
jgi:hypothetical protein